MPAVRPESYRSAGLQPQPCFIETLDQAGLSEVLFTKLPESLAERVAVADAFGKRLQVQQDGDCRVVFTRFPGADERAHLLPGFLLPERQGIQALLMGGGCRAHLAAQFLGSPLRGDPFPFLAPGGCRVPELPGRPCSGIDSRATC